MAVVELICSNSDKNIVLSNGDGEAQCLFGFTCNKTDELIQM